METLDKAWHTAADTLKSEINSYQLSQSSQKPWTEYGKEEPLSGIQGKGTLTDPYDAGNRDEQPGAPKSQQNTAVVPEALVSTADDATPDLKPVTNGSLDSRSDSRPSGNKFVGVMETPEQRTQPPPPSLTTPTTGRASAVAADMNGHGRDSVAPAAATAGGSGTTAAINGVKEEKEKEKEEEEEEEEEGSSSTAAATAPWGSRMPQYQPKSQNPITKSQNPITSSRTFSQTPTKMEKTEDPQKAPSKVTNVNDQTATVPSTTSNLEQDTRRLSLQKDKYTGAEMSKRQSLYESKPQGGEGGSVDEGKDYINNSNTAGLSISGTPGVPSRPPATSKASEEALKGPQCSAKPPYDFEKQLDDPSGRRKSKSSHKKSDSTGDASAIKSAEKTPSSEASTKSGSKNGSKNGLHNTMSHMKEKLKKVVHQDHHSDK
ncbi:uncharacterized protein KD926_003637 [Aspergillus affinis]|uniref:uncharacterized protein n=1 Tax=Aspergillus affinis TaxID=1070780 RepID=UPI0022FEC3C8|nr:uncharacterized protein KD926_003637 [Aspergillus affinis]KAI9043486.1 hypothetical protein KD926_003637 [Aspergillus affinis]